MVSGTCLAPYSGEAFLQAVQRVVSHPIIDRVLGASFPDRPIAVLKDKARHIRSVEQFQLEFIDLFLRNMEKRSTDGITLSGLENIRKNDRYLFISNHRDIILDPALLTDMLLRSGFDTPQICLGDNLLQDGFVTDLVKMNKGITVKRGLPPRELLCNSILLSDWIRSTIVQQSDSVWIAQAEGRAKDGNDRTQPGVLKMLALSGDGSFTQRLRSLKIIPVSISYEFDPSDVEKAFELHEKIKTGRYHKGAGEDLATIRRGLCDQKGGIHIEIGSNIEDIIDSAEPLRSRSEQAAFIANKLDVRIRNQYKNWPSNFIASDLLAGTPTHQTCYATEQRTFFLERLDRRLNSCKVDSLVEGDVRERCLKMYAATVPV